MNDRLKWSNNSKMNDRFEWSKCMIDSNDIWMWNFESVKSIWIMIKSVWKNLGAFFCFYSKTKLWFEARFWVPHLYVEHFLLGGRGGHTKTRHISISIRQYLLMVILFCPWNNHSIKLSRAGEGLFHLH